MFSFYYFFTKEQKRWLFLKKKPNKIYKHICIASCCLRCDKVINTSWKILLYIVNVIPIKCISYMKCFVRCADALRSATHVAQITYSTASNNKQFDYEAAWFCVLRDIPTALLRLRPNKYQLFMAVSLTEAEFCEPLEDKTCIWLTFYKLCWFDETMVLC